MGEMLRTEDGKKILAASDVTDKLACPHLIAQKLLILRGERGKPRPADDPYAELISAKGEEHEREQLARLESELGPAVDLGTDGIPRTDDELLAAATATAGVMASGAPLIFQATFFDGTWQGRTDFLRRVDVPSSLGEHSYEVIDTKLARRVKPHFVHQLLLYSRLLGGVQGFTPELAHLILGDGTETAVELRRYEALHRHTARAVARLVGEPCPETYPEPIEHCAVCGFVAECSARLREDDHLSLVAGASRIRRERLIDLGIETVAELADAPEDTDPRRLGAESFGLLRSQAALQVESRESGEPTRRHLPPVRAAGYAALPDPSSGDVFFDLEGDPFLGPDGIEYLWGWWRENEGYECVWAHDPVAEKEALERFVDEVGDLREQHPGMHVYHYAPHERSKLRSLAIHYGTREAEVDQLLRNGVLVDLFSVVKQALQVGEESYSLKRLERHHGFKRRETSVREGGGSIVMYERWLELGLDEMLESIRAYNEEDCRSTASLRDWLLGEMRPEAEAELGIDFAEFAEPEPEEDRPPPAWLADVEALADRLLDGLSPDAADDSPEEARRRLMSHLLLYHHREGKPEWWRYFDLRSLSTDDLLYERDAISGLVRDETVEPFAVTKRSLGYTFTFPEQEHKLALGGVADPTTDAGYNLVELNDRSLVVSRDATKPPPAPVALVGPSPRDPSAMREALVEIGAAVERGEDGNAVVDLLDREPPRLDSDLLGEDVETLIDAALALDRGVLPIQGPPGTGKTYRAAHMIVGALASGLRVGVTAQSHAAIQNLLRETERVARDWPLRFSGVYRGEGYRSPTRMIELAGANNAVTDDHQLVAGTAWLLSRPEHRGRFDLLFVDEAGQYSLANAVAAGSCARGIVLLGDPQQLPQVTQAPHPFGSGASALGHVLGEASTIEGDRGVLLTETWRMHPDVCRYVSERSYDGKLRSRDGCELRSVRSAGPIGGAGLRTMPVQHAGRSQYSPEEAAAIAAACRELLADGVVTDAEGGEAPLEPEDIMVVAPYNMAVNEISSTVPEGVRVGTVDRFQGQEAPVVFYAMTCSAGEDVPRGLDFLFDRHRMNVAISRAQCSAILVYSPRLLEANCPTLEAMELIDGVCRFVEMAPVVDSAA